MKSLRLFLFFIIPIQLFSQNFFESGYYIDNNGTTITGFINNEYWYNSPESVSFRTAADSETTVLSMDKVSAFGIGSHTKYIRHIVAVDKNKSVNLAYINPAYITPQFVNKTVFLNTLLEGKANLYSLTLDDDRKYFVSKSDAPVPVQLVYKKFIDTDSKVRETWEYRTLLYQEYRCSEENGAQLKKLAYNQNAIKDYITAYNSCSGAANVVYATERRTIKLKFTAFAGAVMSNYNINNAQAAQFKSASGIAPLVGIDASLVLPAHSNRYEIFFRGSFETLSAENFANRSTTGTSGTFMQDQVVTDLTIINLGIGPRYNFILNQNSRVFIEGVIGFSMASGDITYNTRRVSPSGTTVQNTQTLPVAGDLLTSIGLGYVFNNKYGISINSDLAPKSLVGSNWIVKGTALHNISAQLRYTFN